MSKYWGKQIFSLGSFPEVGQKQKTEKKERKRERTKVGNNTPGTVDGSGFRDQMLAVKSRKKTADNQLI